MHSIARDAAAPERDMAAELGWTQDAPTPAPDAPEHGIDQTADGKHGDATAALPAPLSGYSPPCGMRPAAGLLRLSGKRTHPAHPSLRDRRRVVL